jgi:putative tryptophan/tyrosine transport system substrate-binding protein
MKRREFISLISGVAATWPLAARAQQRRVPVVGFLRGGTEAGAANLLAAFRKGLSETGFVEGRNLTIEFRWGLDSQERRAEARPIWFGGTSTSSLHLDFPWLRWPPRR